MKFDWFQSSRIALNLFDGVSECVNFDCYIKCFGFVFFSVKNRKEFTPTEYRRRKRIFYQRIIVSAFDMHATFSFTYEWLGPETLTADTFHRFFFSSFLSKKKNVYFLRVGLISFWFVCLVFVPFVINIIFFLLFLRRTYFRVHLLAYIRSKYYNIICALFSFFVNQKPASNEFDVYT